jgi:mono/diheme cytochrome c family protein
MMEKPMNLVSRLQPIAALLVLLLAIMTLTACEQPEAPPGDTAAEQAAEAASSGGVGSVDADGNIAPFGFASRKPVAVEEPMPPAPPPPTGINSELFAVHCVACHGTDANGVEGLGVTLMGSAYVADSDEMQLVAFLQIGRAVDAPDNTTGVPMPPFGWMQPEQLAELAAYQKSLHQL